jgi:integrase
LTLERYEGVLNNFSDRFSSFDRVNILNYMAELSSVSSMKVFLAAIKFSEGISYFNDRDFKDLLRGKARFLRPPPFKPIINVLDFAAFVSSPASGFSDWEKFCLQLSMLTAARPSDLARLGSADIVITSSSILVNRFDTKADRWHKGTPVHIPRTPSVLVTPIPVVGFPFIHIGRLMAQALTRCFPGGNLTPKTIRSSVVSLLARRGAPTALLMEIGGWLSEPTMRSYYIRVNKVPISTIGLIPVTPFSLDSWPEAILSP